MEFSDAERSTLLSALFELWITQSAFDDDPDRDLVPLVAKLCVAGKDAFTSIYTAGDFLGRHSQERSGTGAIPQSVIFSYGIDLLCAAQPDHYSMNPLLGQGTS